MSGFELHPEAYIDLDELWEFIAADNIDAADRVRDKIFDAIQSLVPLPHQGHRRTDLTSRPLRFWRVYEYLTASAIAPIAMPSMRSLRRARLQCSPIDRLFQP